MATLALGLFLPLATIAETQEPAPETCADTATNDAQECPEAKQAVPVQPVYPLDWVPLEAVPESLLNRQCINCEGRYIDPLAAAHTGLPPDESAIHARADTSELLNNEVILIGSADAVQGYRQMRGDKVVVHRAEESAFLSGNVTLREPGILVRGESAQIFSRTGEATVTDSRFVFHPEHMRGTADLLERDADGLIHVHNGTFTYCAPGENDWSVHSRDMEVDLEEGLATAHHASIEVEGVPVFYSPWLRFPLDDRRRTGFLWPDFGNDSTGGLDLTVPFYINLAPNYDAQYSPRYIEERGVNQELNLRYLDPLLGFWSVGGTYMKHDNKYSDQTPENVSDDRWLAVVKQNGLLDQRWRSTVDYSKASDVDYMKDLEPYSLDAQRKTSLQQKAALDYLGDSWLLNLEAQQFQSLADDISDDYKKLPQFTGQYRASGIPFELQPIALGQYTNFGSDDNRVTGERVYGEAGMSYPMLWSYGFLTPTLKYRQLNYELSDGVVYDADNPSTSAPLANLDGGLVFERRTSFGDQGLLQTLEPRLYYLYSPYEDQTNQPDFDSAELTFTYYQLFRETRFSGHDRLDDANQLSIGLTSRFLDDETGRSLLSASIGQIVYFADRKVRLLPVQPPLDESTSDIAGELDFTPTENLGLRSSVVWNPHDNNMDSGHIQSSYQTEAGAIFNLGYSFLRPVESSVFTLQDTEEVSVSSYLPLNRNWSVFAAMDYSLEGDTSVEDMVGVEYDSCCWTFRLMHLRYYDNVSGTIPNFNDPDLERESTTQFQIVLKGMGGFGNRITDVMRDMIRGFDEREY